MPATLTSANDAFSLAASFINYTNRSVFLTGRAGTGKTTFLRHIQEQTTKKAVVVAPTGVAAVNAGGVTIHSLFQLPLGAYLPGTRKGWSSQGELITDRHTLMSNIRFNSEKRRLLMELELLIMDEVSMLRADLLDAIDHILRHVRHKPLSPFGGVQVLFIGDLYQLPPVVNQGEWQLLAEYYSSPFFFDAQVLKEAPPVQVELQKIYRQTEGSFINLLNSIRGNYIEPEQLEELHQRYQPDFRPPAGERHILLTSHNRKADEVNTQELDALKTILHQFEATVSGDFNDKAYPAERTLRLKEGAQIMFLKNDRGEDRRYYNGKLGIVSAINDDGITITLDGGGTLVLEPEEWKNIRYNYNDKKQQIEEEELGTFRQFPIRLAWAVTIHKSQGLTFERAIVDAGDSFAPGQVYVALSRLTTLGGLVLRTRIGRAAISTDPRIVEYSNGGMRSSLLADLQAREQHLFVEQRLIEAFDLESLTTSITQQQADFTSRGIALVPEVAQAISTVQEEVTALTTIAAKFYSQLKFLLTAAPLEENEALHQRVTAAVTYFSKALKALIIKLQSTINIAAAKKGTKHQLNELLQLKDKLIHQERKMSRIIVLTEKLCTVPEKAA